jgi:hypothetical protein
MGRLFRGPFFCAKPGVDFLQHRHFDCAVTRRARFLQKASMKTQSKATAKPGSAKSPKIKLAGKKSPLVVSPRLAANHNETFLPS